MIAIVNKIHSLFIKIMSITLPCVLRGDEDTPLRRDAAALDPQNYRRIALVPLSPVSGEIIVPLQHFAAEDEGRTEEPTEKKIRDARNKGQVAKTEELPQALVVIAGMVTLLFLGKWMFGEIVLASKYYFTAFSGFKITENTVLEEGWRITVLLAKLVGPVFAVCVVAGLAGNIAQVGFQFSSHPLTPDFSKIKLSPAEMVKKIFFSPRVAMNLFKSIFKVGVIGFVSYLIISGDFVTIMKSADAGVVAVMCDVSFTAFKIVLISAILLVALAIPDYLFQRREFLESLKMSKQEIKEEMKESQGDPHVRSRLREMQRDILTRNMIREVPKADVVVTNPTHFAIALKWNQETMAAPSVIAKGVDSMALRIREVAKSNNIMMIENRPLAQTLYKEVEVGNEIPAELFQAVSEIYYILYQNGRLASSL